MCFVSRPLPHIFRHLLYDSVNAMVNSHSGHILSPSGLGIWLEMEFTCCIIIITSVIEMYEVRLLSCTILWSTGKGWPSKATSWAKGAEEKVMVLKSSCFFSSVKSIKKGILYSNEKWMNSSNIGCSIQPYLDEIESNSYAIWMMHFSTKSLDFRRHKTKLSSIRWFEVLLFLEWSLQWVVWSFQVQLCSWSCSM